MVNASSGGYNNSGIVIAILALFELHTRPAHVYREQITEKAAHTRPAIAGDDRHWLTSAIPLGSLIFSLHCLLSDSSTLIVWSWTGYANRRPQGPQPNLHGSVTLIAQSVGLMIPILLAPRKSRILNHPLWLGYGATSSFVMYQYRNWLGYSGGLMLAIFLMSIIPGILCGAASASKERVAKTYFIAWLIACLMDFASVWTVAYAFVPGGVYLRERTDLCVFFFFHLLLCIPGN
jgi:hypothetical protein